MLPRIVWVANMISTDQTQKFMTFSHIKRLEMGRPTRK